MAKQGDAEMEKSWKDFSITGTFRARFSPFLKVEVGRIRIQVDWAQGDAKVTSLNGWYRRSIRGIRREDHHVRHGQGPALVRAEQGL